MLTQYHTCISDDMMEVLYEFVLLTYVNCVMCLSGGGQQHYNVNTEPVWQPQYGSRMDSSSSARGHPSVNGARYADDGYGGDLDSSGHFDLEPAFTQQQVNGSEFGYFCRGWDSRAFCFCSCCALHSWT